MEWKQREEPIGDSTGRSSVEVGKVLETTALTRNKPQLFPTTRRPEKCSIPTEDQVSQKVVNE